MLVLVHLAEKRAVAQLAVGERVDLGRRMRIGAQFSQHDAEHRRIGQVLEIKAAHIEVAVGEDQAARGQVMADAGNGRALGQAVGGLDGRGPDVGDRQLRQLRHILGRIRRLLHAAKQRDLILDALEVVVGEAGGQFGQVSLPRVVLLLDGDHLHLGHMGAVQEHLADEALEIPLVKRAAQVGEVVLVVQVGCGKIVVVEPAAQRRHGKRHAVGHAEVAFAHDELGAGDGRLHERVVKPACGQALKLGIHGRAQTLRGVFAQVAHLQHGEGLLHGICQVGLHVPGYTGVQKRALERCLVAAGDGVEQDIDGHDARALAHVPDDPAQAQAGVFRRGCHLAAHAQGAHGPLHGQGARCKLRKPLGCALLAAFRLLGGHGRQVALIQERQHAVKVQVAVQDDVAVVQAVVPLVFLQVMLVGERGDGLGGAAGLERVGGVGEQACLQLVVQHAGGIGQRAFHLVVHHAVIGKLAAGLGLRLFGVGHLKVPALLLEHLALEVDVGVQHRVHVDVGQVHKVLVVGGCHGVERLIAEGHGVQKRLHAGFQQVDEGLLDGELLRTAQNRVLQDVEHAGVVGRRGAEGDGERLVAVVVAQV